MYWLRTFGGFSIEQNGAPRDQGRGHRKAHALLAVLAAQGSTGRERLMALLWPESDAERAKGSLKQAIHLLRRELDAPDLLLGTAELRLNPERIESDVDLFSRALAGGDAATAVRHYGGPFLDGVHLDGTSEFERWAETQRTELARQYRDALEQLARAAEAQGDHPSAAGWWRRLQAADPPNSRVAVNLMLALEASGDRAAALQHARLHETLLVEEWGIAPDPAVRALAERLRSPAPPPVPQPESLAVPGAERASQAVTPPATAAGHSGEEGDGSGAVPARVAPDALAAEEREALHGAASTALEAAAGWEATASEGPALAPARGAAGWEKPVPPTASSSADSREPLSPNPAGASRYRRRSVVAGVLVLVLVLIGALVLDRSSPVLSSERVFVAAFDNQTGDPGLDPLGHMAADWLTQGLAQAGVAEVVPTITPFGMPEGADSLIPNRDARPRILAHARQAGAGTVVWGAYYRHGDSVLVQAQITDVRTGRVVGGIPAVGGRADRPLEAVEAMRGNVIALLAARFDKTVASLAEVSSQPPSLEAYREYTEGVENFLRSEFSVAVSHFDRAVALDSSFSMAAIWGVFARFNLGRYAQADSITQRLSSYREQLPPFDRAMLDALRATFPGDLPEQARATRAAAELAPGSFGQYAAAFYALRINHPREAIELLSGVDPDRADHRGWIWYWNVLTAAHHVLGEHRQELQAAREARKRYPDRPEAVGWEARALAALRRIEEMEATLAELPHLPASGGLAPPTALREIAEELRAHGNTAASERLLERIIAAYARLPAEQLASPAVRSGLAAALYRLGRYREARELFATLASENPASVEYQGYLGVIAAREGDRHEAERIAVQLANLDRPYLFGLNTFWRARIAALLGHQQDAIRLLQAAFAEGRPYSIAWHSEPDFESLHPNPAFRRLLRPTA